MWGVAVAVAVPRSNVTGACHDVNARTDRVDAGDGASRKRTRIAGLSLLPFAVLGFNMDGGTNVRVLSGSDKIAAASTDVDNSGKGKCPVERVDRLTAS